MSWTQQTPHQAVAQAQRIKDRKAPSGNAWPGHFLSAKLQQLPGGSVSPDVPGDPVRALSGSWAQGLPVFLVSLIIGNCFHSASILWVPVGRFKQLIVREGRGCETKEKQTIKSSLGVTSGFIIKGCCYISVTKSCPTLCDPTGCSTLGSSVLHYLLECTQIHVHWVTHAIKPSHPLLPPSPFAFSLSQHQGLFQWNASSLQVAKVLELQLSISPSSEYSGVISFRIDWFDSLLSKGLSRVFSRPQFESIDSSVLSLLYGPALTLYTTTRKTMALNLQTFVGEVMSLLFNTLSRFVIAFLPRSKHLLISWLQSPSAVILEYRKIKSVTASIFSPSICHEVMGRDAMILDFFNTEF